MKFGSPRVRRVRLGWACLLAGAGALTGSAAAQLGVGDLYSDDLSGATPDLTFGFHDERFAPNTNAASADQSVLTQWGLSGFAVPSAPPGDSLNDEALLIGVNNVDNLPGEGPERVAVNLSPNVTIDSATQDWVMTVNAYANTDGGAANTTLAFLAGMHSDPSRVNWQGGTDTDGLFWSLTTDGRASNDLLSFQGTPNAPATAFSVLDIDGEVADVDNVPPSFADRWVTLAVGSHANTPFFAVRTHEADGHPNAWQVQESFGNAGGASLGSPWFGVEDLFNSATPDLAVAFRNASVSTLRAGDTDLDGDVDFDDAMTLRANFSGDAVAADVGGAVPAGFDADLWLWTVGDFDQDRDVDFDDALQLVAHYDSQAEAVLPPGEPDPPFSASLFIDEQTGAMTVVADGQVSGVSIRGDGMSYGGLDSAALDLVFAAEADAFVAVSSSDGLSGSTTLGLRASSGVENPSDWTFAYGVGGNSFVGQVQVVPEPGLAVMGLALFSGFWRWRVRG